MKKNKLALALATFLGLGASATSVQAVNLAENGVGEYGIIPYFSVTKGQIELINVVNTSNKTVAVRVGIRRGTDSNEVRDFIVIMSPKDVWTGFIRPNAAGTNAEIVTSDKSCTIPDKSAWTSLGGSTYSVAFDPSLFGSAVTVPSAWVTSAPIGTGSTAIQKIQEGYVTLAVMGMSDFPNTTNSVSFLSTHVAGTPRNCGAIAATWSSNLAAIKGQFTQAENTIRTSAIMVDAAASLAIGVPVTSMANVFNDGQTFAAGTGWGTGVLGVNNITPSAQLAPDETYTSPRTANVFESNTQTLYSGSFTLPEQAFAAVLMNDSVYGTFDTTAGTKSSWVVNFPTKRSMQIAKSAPFIETCVPYGANVWDNEEGTTVDITNNLFSPFVPPVVQGKKLCYEVNVVDFKNNNPLKSLLVSDSGVSPAAGWMQLGFPNAAGTGSTSLSTATGTTPAIAFSGMPVIGFEYFENGGLSAANNLGLSKSIK